MFEIRDRSLVLERDSTEVETGPATVAGHTSSGLGFGLGVAPFVDVGAVRPDTVDVLADPGEQFQRAEVETVEADPPIRVVGARRDVHGEQLVTAPHVVDEEDTVGVGASGDLGVGEHLGFGRSVDDREHDA